MITPVQKLFLLLAIIRGARSVPYEVLEVDIIAWTMANGPITHESVKAWALESDELKFASQVLANREE